MVPLKRETKCHPSTTSKERQSSQEMKTPSRLSPQRCYNSVPVAWQPCRCVIGRTAFPRSQPAPAGLAQVGDGGRKACSSSCTTFRIRWSVPPLSCCPSSCPLLRERNRHCLWGARFGQLPGPGTPAPASTADCSWCWVTSFGIRGQELWPGASCRPLPAQCFALFSHTPSEIPRFRET